MPTGKVYLIGAGPGDPGLLTLKGKRCLEEAGVVIYDYLVDQRVLAYARPEAELIYVGKKSGGEAVPQMEINRLIIERAHKGEKVARLKGGDPFLFGRGGEEAEELVAAKVPFEGEGSDSIANAQQALKMTVEPVDEDVLIQALLQEW